MLYCRGKVADTDAVGDKPGKGYNNGLWSFYEAEMVKICHKTLILNLIYQ